MIPSHSYTHPTTFPHLLLEPVQDVLHDLDRQRLRDRPALLQHLAQVAFIS